MPDVPLDDPAYVPQHPPINGRVPDVVEKWGAASQLRWFGRFASQLKPAPWTEWARFYLNSTEHRGECCTSCEQDRDYGFDLDVCCCRGIPDTRPASSIGETEQ